MKRNYKTIIIISLLVLLIIYILNSNMIATSIINYTNLFITKLFPSSFIIFIFSSLLIDYGIIQLLSSTKINGNIIYVSLMSLISGFPSGVKYTKELLDKNLISPKTANYLIAYTHFPNPIFLLGPISSILTKPLALKLLMIIIISNTIIAIIFKPKKETFTLPKTSNTSFATSLKKATYASLKTLTVVYSSSLFFYLISIIITKYISLDPLNYVILNGLFDLTQGIFSSPIISSITTRAIVILFFLSFGSISIHIQTKSIIADTSINYNKYLLGRVLETIIALSLFIILN